MAVLFRLVSKQVFKSAFNSDICVKIVRPSVGGPGQPGEFFFVQCFSVYHCFSSVLVIFLQYMLSFIVSC